MNSNEANAKDPSTMLGNDHQAATPEVRMGVLGALEKLGGTLRSYEQVTSRVVLKAESTLFMKVSVLVSVVPCLAMVQASHLKKMVPEVRLPLEPAPVMLRAPLGFVRVVVPIDGPKVMADDENPEWGMGTIAGGVFPKESAMPGLKA